MDEDRGTELALIAFRLDEISTKVDALGESIKGNGKPGLVLQLSQIHRDVEAFKTDQERIRREIIELRQQNELRKEEMDSFKNRIKGAAIAISLFSIGSGGGLIVFLQQLIGG